MKKAVSVPGLIAVALTVTCAVVLASSTIDPIGTATISNRVIRAICRLPEDYLLVGGRPTGEQPWETEPSIVFHGGTTEENRYTMDGVDVSEVGEGTVSAVDPFEFIQETSIRTGGYEAEYGAAAAVLDYQHGGGVLNVITKSGANEYRAEFIARFDESLDDLAHAEDGTLWAAGNAFEAEGTVPVLGYFDEDGTFIRVDNSLEGLGGFFHGIDFTGLPIAFGNTLPNDAPTRPLMVISPTGGQTWEAPASLPWMYGTIDTAMFLDPLHGWVGGETPDGGTFAYTQDGGKTWMKQTMPDVTYIWDLEIAQVWPECGALQTFGDPLSTPYISDPMVLGAALGTHYLDDGSKESIVYRTLDGWTWEELWRVAGYGGDLYFSYRGDGEIAIVQNGLDGTATFSRYAAHDFFGAENLIVCGEITYGGDMAYTDEPLPLHLDLYGLWGKPIQQDTVHWAADHGSLVVDTDDPMFATFVTSEPVDVTVTCSLRDQELQIERRFQVQAKH